MGAGDRHYWLLWGYPTRSWLILGTAELRNGWGVSLQRVMPSRHLSYGPNQAKVVFEAYYLNTEGLNRGPKIQTHSIGGIVLARYEYGPPTETRPYWEAGWGLQWANRKSPDLDTRLNSTPVAGAGIVFRGRAMCHLGVRFIHMSNAGTNKPNNGQNQLQLMIGCRL